MGEIYWQEFIPCELWTETKLFFKEEKFMTETKEQEFMTELCVKSMDN